MLYKQSILLDFIQINKYCVVVPNYKVFLII